MKKRDLGKKWDVYPLKKYTFWRKDYKFRKENMVLLMIILTPMIKIVLITGKIIPLSEPNLCSVSYTTIEETPIEGTTLMFAKDARTFRVGDKVELIFSDEVGSDVGGGT